MLNCHNCINERAVPGNAHIACAKPDMNIKGNPHGIKKGWFVYPILFDPVWGEGECANFESSVSHPVSEAVSRTPL